MIAKITRAYVRRYTDTGQAMAIVEWRDDHGKQGVTEGDYGPCRCCGAKPKDGSHMAALFDRARREGITIER